MHGKLKALPDRSIFQTTATVTARQIALLKFMHPRVCKTSDWRHCESFHRLLRAPAQAPGQKHFQVLHATASQEKPPARCHGSAPISAAQTWYQTSPARLPLGVRVTYKRTQQNHSGATAARFAITAKQREYTTLLSSTSPPPPRQERSHNNPLTCEITSFPEH